MKQKNTLNTTTMNKKSEFKNEESIKGEPLNNPDKKRDVNPLANVPKMKDPPPPPPEKKSD